METKATTPAIFRKRLLIEGYFTVDIEEQTLKDFFSFITQCLALESCGDPLISGINDEGNKDSRGYDAFLPLADSGMHLAVWHQQQFLSLILYTCKDLNEEKVLRLTREFFFITQSNHKLF